MSSQSQRLPHDLEAEASLLGAVLVRPRIIAELGMVAAADFFHPGHGFVWAAMQSRAAAGIGIDEVTLGDELGDKLEAVGGLAYLATLANRGPIGNHAYYAAIVRGHAATRRLMLGLSEVIEAAKAGEERDELAAKARSVVQAFEGAAVSQFASSAERINGESAERMALAARELKYNVTFLDDFLRGILPHDLVVIGARTGAGKTELARLVAQTNAQQGRRVYLFALEAEPKEIERRTKFAVLSQAAHELNLPGREELNYPDWYRGRCGGIVGKYEAEADEIIARKLKTLHTFYRGIDFDVQELERRFRELQGKADLVILDHLHYVDTDDDQNENRAVRGIVKALRNVSLTLGIPVLVVAHLRKRDRVRRQLVPEADDFHGTSDITKIATGVILLEPARDQPSQNPWIAHTYMHVPKMRGGGACPYVALCGFDLRRNTYERNYMLGRLSFGGDEIEFLDRQDYPRWAKHGGNGT